MRQHDSPPDEDDYGGDDGGEEHEPAEYSQSYNASCGVIFSCCLSRQSDNLRKEQINRHCIKTEKLDSYRTQVELRLLPRLSSPAASVLPVVPV